MFTLKDTGRFLIEHNIQIATAESITGGMIASDLVSVPGISSVFKQGFITYSNDTKRELLGVKESTLKKYGAVSPQTARQMALYVKKRTGADIGLASTGIAGPDGGSKIKPVGLCFVSCAVYDKVVTRGYVFKGPRFIVRHKCANAAISLLRDCLARYYT